MGYVPDDAMRRKREVTHSAWDVYEALCSFADPDTGIVEERFCPNKRLIEQTGGLKLGTVKNAMTELRRERWTEHRGGRIRLLVGTFLGELREQHSQRGQQARPSPAGDARPAQPSLYGDEVSPAGDASSPTNDGASPANDAPSPTGDGRSNKVRARVLTRPDQTGTRPASTHTPDRRAREAPAVEAGGVCVPDLTFNDYLAYAKSEPGFTNPPAWAMKHFPLRDADALVAEWKARREQIREGRPPEQQQYIPYHVALQIVSSVAQAAGADVAAFIAGMENMTEETRAQLRKKFLTAPAADAAAGRAPP